MKNTPILVFALFLVASMCGACGEGSSSSGSGGGGGPGLSQGGSQDFGLFRDILERGELPGPETLEELGFFAEHKIELPQASCGEDVCLHGALATVGNLLTGSTSSVVMIGLNTPIDPDELDRPPLDLAIAVDTSGSMSGDSIEYVQLGLLDMLPALGDDDVVTLIAYSEHAEVLIETVDSESVALENAIRALDAAGTTNIYEGLRVAFESLPGADPSRQRRVILLSDGVATAGILNDERIVRMARDFSQEGIGLTTIGVGTEFNVELMRSLSEIGAGNFYFVEDPRAVREVFTEEVETFLVPIAQDVVITLTEESGYALNRIHGTRLWNHQSTGVQIEIPSLFLAGRETVDDDQLGRRGGGGAILALLLPADGESMGESGLVTEITLEWDDPETGERYQQSTDVVSPSSLAGSHFDDATVEKAFVMLNIYMAFEMATERASDGALSDALKILNAIAPNVADWLSDHEDADIEADYELIERFIDNLIDYGAAASPPSAAPLPEPWY